MLICTEIGSDIRMVGEGSLEPCIIRACVDMCGWWQRVALQALNLVLPVRDRLISHMRMVQRVAFNLVLPAGRRIAKRCACVCARVRLFVCYW